MGTTVIEVQNVSKSYKIYAHPRHRLLEALGRGRRKYHHDFWALRDVSFEVKRGDTLGIIGLNGSGKSTLLQVIAGIVQPTLGGVAVTGRVGSLLELGAGFNPEFTGRENVLMQGVVAGFGREEIEARLPLIEAFAGIGAFIDQPVKTYSNGMFVRLAFAAAIHIDPDILLVDEALAVGDAIFQHRCIRKIKEFQAQGKTICFVSHDMGAVKAVCSKAILLHAGEVVKVGDPEEIVNLYHSYVASIESRRIEAGAVKPVHRVGGGSPKFLPDPEFDRRVALFRHGTGAARIRNVQVLDGEGSPLEVVEFNREIILRVHIEFYEEVVFYIVGYFFRDKNGLDLVGTNTYEEGISVPSRYAGETLVVDFRQSLPLMPGTYSITTAVAYSRHLPTYLDWVDNALIVEVLPPGDKYIHGKVWLPIEISLHT